MEYLKTFHKLCKTIKQGKTVSQVLGAGKNSNSTLYRETTKREIFWQKKKYAKIAKRCHAYKE